MRIVFTLRAGLIAGMLLSAPLVFAEDFISSNFKTTNPGINTFSGSGTSSTFSNVQAGGQAVTGEATSTNFLLTMGFMYFDSYAPKSQNWRWYDDEENETPTTALAAENVAPTNVEDLNVIKLRIAIAETADIGASNVKLRLQYSTSSDFSSGAIDLVSDAACAGGSVWCYADGGGVDGALISTKLLTDTDSCAASIGSGCGTYNETATTSTTATHVKSAIAEYEFTIQQSGADVNMVYFFRPVDVASSSTVPLNTGEAYPSLLTGGSSLYFTINGLASGTVTEGDTTGITSTSTSIPFGSLLIDSTKVAAQRLTVSTNGTGGYKIYAYERQGLLSDTGGTIPPISGTNASPVAWAAGCASLDGCYGYHSGEDVLEGGSTRFAANDTFAQLTSTPNEIAYNAGPANNKETDILYRLVVRDEQRNGEYSANIVYIVTPVF